MRSYQKVITTIFLLALVALLWSRDLSVYDYRSERVLFAEPISHPLLLSAMSGPVPGLASDFQILNVFSVYDAIYHSRQTQFAPLLVTYLNNASELDPYFFDTYRLASSILVYDSNMAKEGVELLEYGSHVLTDNWELPFFGGIIAHEFLKDDKKAFQLMSLVLERPKAPHLAVNLAANYLKNNHSVEDAIVFLEALAHRMPKKYRKNLDKKIQSLKSEQE